MPAHADRRNPYRIAARWLGVESALLALLGITLGMDLAFEGASSYQDTVWADGPQAFMSLRIWGAGFIASGVVILASVIAKRLPAIVTGFFCAYASFFATLLLQTGQSPVAPAATGVMAFALVGWGALIVIKQIDLRLEVDQQAKRGERRRLLAEEDERARREILEQESRTEPG